MSILKSWHTEIKEKSIKKIIYSFHATVQMNLPERLITTTEIREVISKGTIIEERLDDPRGETFLLSGKTSKKRYIHVVYCPKEECLTIVTAYIPDPNEWRKNFTERVIL
jgi:hypothetical protein